MRVQLGSSEVFVTFRVKPSDTFRRDREDIHSDIEISIAQATLGGIVKVQGINGEQTLEVNLPCIFFKKVNLLFRFQLEHNLINVFD